MFSGKHTTARGWKVATAKEFVEFWLLNSVHADEQLAPGGAEKRFST
jgi:hypothetical protein